jgi:hypothetical protein
MRCSPGEALLWWRACRWGGGAGEGPKEWSRQPEKWSGRSSLATQNSQQGPWGGGGRRQLTEEDNGGVIPLPGFGSRGAVGRLLV